MDVRVRIGGWAAGKWDVCVDVSVSVSLSLSLSLWV